MNTMIDLVVLVEVSLTLIENKFPSNDIKLVNRVGVLGCVCVLRCVGGSVGFFSIFLLIEKIELKKILIDLKVLKVFVKIC